PSPAAAEGVSIPTPELSQLTEPAAVAKTREQPKPADQTPAQTPATIPQAADAPEPVKDPTPETTPAPAAAPAPSPPVAVNKKPEAKPNPPTKSPVPVSIQSAAERPEWVDKPGKLVDSVYRVSINSGPYVTIPECQGHLDLQMKLAADQYIDDYLGEGARQVVDISPGYLRRHVKKAEFNEVITSTVGPMQQIHALLEFDDSVRADFQHRWHAAVVGRRLWFVGASTGLVLALLGTLYGYLRLDLRTGGTHKGQLQLAAALVALIVTAGALLVQYKLPF
ncbi:MAG TPA: hypothetical protein VGZ26_05805, partial [Pirellulales bacterium]|nr:hypothetical protein [Pirellulales bacterium]